MLLARVSMCVLASKDLTVLVTDCGAAVAAMARPDVPRTIATAAGTRNLRMIGIHRKVQALCAGNSGRLSDRVVSPIRGPAGAVQTGIERIRTAAEVSQ